RAIRAGECAFRKVEEREPMAGESRAERGCREGSGAGQGRTVIWIGSTDPSAAGRTSSVTDGAKSWLPRPGLRGSGRSAPSGVRRRAARSYVPSGMSAGYQYEPAETPQPNVRS